MVEPFATYKGTDRDMLTILDVEREHYGWCFEVTEQLERNCLPPVVQLMGVVLDAIERARSNDLSTPLEWISFVETCLSTTQHSTHALQLS